MGKSCGLSPVSFACSAVSHRRRKQFRENTVDEVSFGGNLIFLRKTKNKKKQYTAVTVFLFFCQQNLPLRPFCRKVLLAEGLTIEPTITCLSLNQKLKKRKKKKLVLTTSFVLYYRKWVVINFKQKK